MILLPILLPVIMAVIGFYIVIAIVLLIALILLEILLIKRRGYEYTCTDCKFIWTTVDVENYLEESTFVQGKDPTRAI